MKVSNASEIAAFLIGVMFMTAVLMLLLAWPFMLIWNYAVVSALTVAKPIDYWVAFWMMSFLALFVSRAGSSKSS